VAKGMRSHETVDHAAGQYKRRGGITTNMAEGYFSQLKRSIDGTHHHVSIEHLNRYLAQFDFMYSLCKQTDSSRMCALIRQTGGRRLTYKPLTSE
jgi:ISXO2-like transposase domain